MRDILMKFSLLLFVLRVDVNCAVKIENLVLSNEFIKVELPP